MQRLLLPLLLAAGLLTSSTGHAAVVQVTTHISGTTTWFHTNTYVLNRFIYVLDGGVLIIEPGTVIKAKPGTDADTSALIVTRGGRINASGTRARPIIFTAEIDDVTIPDDLPTFQRGLWGGVVLLGKAVLNTVADQAGGAANPKYEVFEGLPDAQVSGQFVHRFGGNDDNDSSGIMRYVSIRHAGVVFQPNRELNGLSLGAVGRGTTIEYVETYATADDGFEFFGGTVNTKYLVSAFNDDDAFDTDQGYRGKNQFWFSIQEPGRKEHAGEWNGEPNTLAIGASPIANFEIYNATFIGSGLGSGTANRALTIREYAAPRLYNSVLTEFGGPGVRIDNKSAIHLTNALLDIRDNIWWQFSGNLADVPESQVLFSDTARNNENINPQLRSIGRTNNSRLDPRPLPGSPATTSARTAPNDGFYTPVNYKGAFDTNDLWLDTWTFVAQNGFLTPRAGRTVQVTTHISGVARWYRTNQYVLNRFIYVLNGGELHIEAGTVIKAKPGTDADTSALIVTRGGKIFANGTHNNPIIFTAEIDDITIPDDLPTFQRGLWGGVVILGNSVLNTVADQAGGAANPKYEVFEGLPDAQVNGQFVHRFGGNNDDDDSGVMRYVSIRHAGVVFQPNRELNGLSMGAVGRGTTLEFIETFATADDGFEFFGGTVNTKYLVSAYNDDDAFDTDQGYRGQNQFWFSIQEPGRKEHAGEWNGEPNTLAIGAPPIANFEVYNATFIGSGTASGTANRALTIREYAAPKLYNSIITDFGGPAVRIDNKSAIHLTNGVLDIRDNIWNGFGGVLADTPEAAVLFSDSSRSNLVVDPQLRVINRQPTFRLDPRPLAGSPALNAGRAEPATFYRQTDYIGAFSLNNWATHWTALGELGLISALGASAPGPVITVTPDCIAVNITITLDATSITLSFPSVAGRTYRVQSTAAVPGGWDYEPGSIAGNGNTLAWSAANGGAGRFYRILCE